MSTIRANAIIDGAGGNNATINGKTPLGTSDIASSAQAAAGADNSTVITPLRVRDALNASGFAPVYGCRAWVNFNGVTTVTIRGSGNVSSVVRNSAGNYTVNFATAIQDANYCAVATSATNATGAMIQYAASVTDIAAGSCRINTGSNGTSTNVAADNAIVSLAIFR